jgi:hypothetical protein
MLDALIQLRRPLETSALTSIAQRFPTEATILMLQDAPRNQPLLAAVREGPVSHAVWVAASNALARLRAPGFAAALLREAPLTNSVFVLDPGKAPNGSAGSVMSGIASTQLPPGFPPIAVYSLTTEAAPGEELASDGPTPIYVKRAVIDASGSINWPPDARCFECPKNCPECVWERTEYLANLAHIPNAEVDRAIHPQVIVRWTDLFQVEMEISRALAAQEAGLRRLVQLLASAGALETSELGMKLHITVQISDERSDRSVSLPQYPAVELSLR